MKNRSAISQPMSRTEVFPSQYGIVSGEEWCRLEVDRMARKGKAARVVPKGDLCELCRPADELMEVTADAEDGK